MPTDPVCGMFVPETSDLFSIIDDQKIYFCSKACQEKYTSPEKEHRKLKRRLTVAWSLAIPIILIEYLLPAGDVLGQMNKDLILFALTFPVQFYSGLGFYDGAYHAFKSRSGNMDLLISIGTLTAFIFSTFITFFPGSIPGSEVFFDASAFIITLILTGNFIENLTKKRANRAAQKLLSLIPDSVHLLKENGEVEDVPAGDVEEGNILVVRAGETIPADGVIVEGRSDIDTSTLTGEQNPVLAEEGSKVSSGTVNLNGVIKIRVTGAGKNSTVSQIYDLIQKAASGRAKVQRVADAFSAIFVPVVMALAVAAGLFWFFYLRSTGSGLPVEIAILAFVSVVVIACPCAIGLAGPITLLISSNKASQNGIIIKNGSTLDRLGRVNRFIFDKTGTLTDPDPVISDISVADGQDLKEVMAYASAIEASSNHPIAKAIVNHAKSLEINIPSARDIKEHPGKGISGTVNGKNINITRANTAGGSSVSVEIDGTRAAVISLRYRVREDVEKTVRYLLGKGIKVSMVTGDSREEAERVAGILGIRDIHAEVLPSDKADIVKEYQLKGDYVAFVGDGINDAVALEVADTGIAMGSGSDIAQESGDIILLRNDLKSVVLARTLARRTISKIKQNIGWAIGYNAALIPVAGGALVPIFGLSMYMFLPILAAFAMGMSSSSVVMNSLMLSRALEKEWKKEKVHL